jgi:hypothetical protein
MRKNQKGKVQRESMRGKAEKNKTEVAAEEE